MLLSLIVQLAFAAQLAAGDPCWLGGVPVRDCDARAQLYLPALDLIPMQHWTLVRELVIWDGSGGWACESSDQDAPEQCSGKLGAVLLPGDRYAAAHIRHEVGHIVGDQHAGAVYQAWQATIWPDRVLAGEPSSGLVEGMWRARRGRPIGPDEPWNSSAWHVAREDFADSYARVLLGDPARMPDAARVAFVSALLKPLP